MLQRLLSFEITLLLAAALAGQAQPEPDVAPFAGLRHFDARHTNLLVIADLLPQVQRFLAGPKVRAWRDDPTLARHLGYWRDAIAGAARVIPREVVIGVSTADVEQHVRMLLFAGLSLHVSDRAARGGEDAAAAAADRAALVELRGELLRQLRALRLPELRVWLRPRDPDDATLLFRCFVDLSYQAEAMGAEVRREDAELSLTGEAASLADGERLRDSFVQWGWLADDADPAGDAWVQVIRKLYPVHARVKLEHGGLLITIGAERSDGALAVPVPEPDAETLAWARYDLGDAATILADSSQRWPEQHPTADPADEAFRDGVRAIATWLGDLGRRGEVRLWSADGLHGELVQRSALRPAPPAVPLADSGLTALVPADLPAVVVDGTIGLDSFLSAAIDSTGRLLELAHERSEDRLDEARETLIETYRTHFGTIRRSLSDRAATWFAPPSAVLFQVDRREVRMSMLEPRFGVEMPGLAGLGILDLVPELALIGRAERPAAILDELAGAYQNAVDQTLARLRARGVELAAHVGKDVAAPKDLGLGMPTVVLSGRWAESSAGLPPHVRRLFTAAAVHAFTIGALMHGITPTETRSPTSSGASRSGWNCSMSSACPPSSRAPSGRAAPW